MTDQANSPAEVAEQPPLDDVQPQAPNRYERAAEGFILTVHLDDTWTLTGEGEGLVASGNSIAETAHLVSELRTAGAEKLLSDLSNDQFWAQMVFLEMMKG